MADDPFPSEPFGALVRRMPRYGKLALALGTDPTISRARRATVLAGAIYLFSPIDLVPGLIPILGQLDDLLVVFLALRTALAGLSPERRRAHLAAVGLADDDLATDLRTLGSVTGWVGRRGVALGTRVVGAGARGAARTTLAVGRAGRSAIAAGRERLGRRRRRDDGPPGQDDDAAGR
jgi:uncharacterized membrane protein YkvA (DUF1232 family)